jgi:1,4-alpha-glucan branching enzyme
MHKKEKKKHKEKITHTKDEFKKSIQQTIKRIIHLEECKPFEFLGPHLLRDKNILEIYCYYPDSINVRLKRIGKKRETVVMNKIDPAGFYRAVFKNTTEVFKYKYSIRFQNRIIKEQYDPYSFKVGFGDLDIHLLKEGNHFKSYEKLGAKVKSKNRIKGVQFAVWAPNAKGVSIVGDFNNWEISAHPMDNIDHSGFWGLFVPGVGVGSIYKFAINSRIDNNLHLKTDPYAFQSELRPKTASIVNTLDKYKWNDKEWMKKRKKIDFKKQPISIYEVHLGSWKKDYDNPDFHNDWGYKNYKQLAYELVDYVMEMGYTHIELMPVMEHPLDQSWGYQVINYFAPTSRYGTPEDFMFFIDHCHQNNINVILDWVPGHFPSDLHGLANFDGSSLYAYQNSKKGYHKDWGTYVFDYSRYEIKNFLISNALFWFDKYHIDGLRVDAVASMLYLDYSRKDGEWEPNIFGGNENLEAIDFIKDLNKVVHKYYKGILMIAEESSAWSGVSHPVHLGGLGFDMKWNMGWMHDLLSYFSKDPIYRKFHHEKLTFSLWYAFNENFILPISHDEVVHGKKSLLEKMPGDTNQKYSNLRMFFILMFGHPGKKLNFMSNDIAQHNEWNQDSSLDWQELDNEFNKKLNLLVKDLNNLYRHHNAFHEIDFVHDGFQWIDFSDSDNSVISFVRKSSNEKEILLFVFNLTPVLRANYTFGVPMPGFYKEILNSDAKEYGGSGKENFGGVHSKSIPWFDFFNSITISLPPLSAIIFKHYYVNDKTNLT